MFDLDISELLLTSALVAIPVALVGLFRLIWWFAFAGRLTIEQAARSVREAEEIVQEVEKAYRRNLRNDPLDQGLTKGANAGYRRTVRRLLARNHVG